MNFSKQQVESQQYNTPIYAVQTDTLAPPETTVLQGRKMELLISTLPRVDACNVLSLSSNLSYLTDASNSVDSGENSDLEIRCATFNVMHPVASLLESSPEHRDTSRFLKAAEQLLRHRIGLINTQESTPLVRNAYLSLGYRAIDADQKEASITLAVEKCRHSHLKSIEPVQPDHHPDSIGSDCMVSDDQSASNLWKMDWRGLTSYYAPDEFEIDPEHHPEFKQYPAEHQKSWSEVMQSLWALIIAITYSFNVEIIREQALALFNSLSGVARIDGLLVSFLTHLSSGTKVILCNTHLESFKIDITARQIGQMIHEISLLKKEHPESLIIVAGDFNYPQFHTDRSSPSNREMTDWFKQELDAVTLDREQMETTFTGGTIIDGVYLIPPSNLDVSDIRGKVYQPMSRTQPAIRWSDHNPVIVHTQLNRKSVS